MLKSLQIDYFRLFENLKIEPLARINLIAGINNTGKTALLEALRIWASNGVNTVINAALKDRGEFTSGWVEAYEALFNPNATKNRIVIVNEGIERRLIPNERVGSYFILLQNMRSRDALNPNVTSDFPKDGCSYIPFALRPFPLEQIWEEITLTDDEDAVIEVVKLADPRIQDIDVRSDGVRVRLKGHRSPVSIGRLGDEVMQTLKVAIGLVSAKNTSKRLLLIDEIESGLHHSVQQLVWEKIFHYAALWGVQVFATTHSQDAVRTFAEVAARPENTDQGCYFRLERDESDKVQAVVYDMGQLATSIEYELET
ncbi:MAG: AAA family ATPase [Saprospiraceae bacterium]